jgi:hypothetical protein
VTQNKKIREDGMFSRRDFLGTALAGVALLRRKLRGVRSRNPRIV